MNGYGERCGNANLVSIIPNLQLKLGYECVSAEQLASLTPTAHFFDELLNFTPDPDQPYVGRNAFAHKGGMHVAGVDADPATFEHIDPAVVGNRRELLISELSGKGTVHARARDAGIELDDARRRPGGRAGQGARAPRATTSRPPTARSSCCCARRPASTSRCSGSSRGGRSSRSAPTAGSRPRRRSRSGSTASATCRTAEGNGPVNALDRALREALGRDPSAPARHRPRQLQGPDPRRDQGHGRDHARAARRLRRRPGVGLDRRLGERDRGLLGGARRLARVRDAGRRARGAATTAAGPAQRRERPPRGEAIPLARPVLGAAEEERVLEVLRSGRLSLGPLLGRVRAGVRRARRGRARERGLERHRRAAPRAARGRGQRRRRGDHDARSRSSPAPTWRSTSARGRCSPTSTR